MDNSGHGALLVPAFNSIPIDEELPVSERFAHGIQEWKQVPAITTREFTITSVVNKLTDKPDWHKGVFQSGIVWQWYHELLPSTPLLSKKTWDWCIEELKDKAKQYHAKAFIRVLDTGSCVCKSDQPHLLRLSQELQTGLMSLHRSHHSTTRDRSIHSYIDPSRYPLIYGKTRVLARNWYVSREGTTSSEHDLVIEHAPTPKNEHIDIDGVKERMGPGVTGHHTWSRAFTNIGWQDIQKYYWSYKYQYLPSDVAFTGGSGCDVHFTSAVNGIHPGDDDLYRKFEMLISTLIELWNSCLIRGQDEWNDKSDKVNGGWAPPKNERSQRGRVPCRIVTYGVEWQNEAPEWFEIFDAVRRKRIERLQKALANIESIKKDQPPLESDEKTRRDYDSRLTKAKKLARGWEDVEGLEQLPEPTPELWQKAFDYLSQADVGSNEVVVLPEDWRNNVSRLLRAKLGRMLLFKHPEPGTAFTYEQWRDGRHGGKAIVDMVTDRPIIPDKPPPSTPHQPYDIRLQEMFREKGLQTVIRVDGVELTPDCPEYPGSEWELKGMKNEHIVAVGIFTYDVENVTESRIAFRQETDISPGFFRHGPTLFQASSGYSIYKQPVHEKGKGDQVGAISEVFGFDPYQMCGDHHDFALPFQAIGDAMLPQGRLIAFPNTMESRRKPFRLRDATQNGHHRWVTVMLVDPNYRICSTGNVLPQQFNKKEEPNDSNNYVADEDARKVSEEMLEEQRRMHYARYTMMGTFFFC